MARPPTTAGLIAALLCAAVSASACVSAAPDASRTDATRGGTLIFAITGEPPSLNRSYTPLATVAFVAQVAVEGLIATDPTGNNYPVLAQEVPTVQNGGVKLSADRRRMDVTYRLRRDVVWSDGTPLTSADVKFTWERTVGDPKVAGREGYEQIESIETPDAVTAVMRYKEIYASYATTFRWLLPRHVLDTVDDMAKSPYHRTPLGTGPFRFTEFVAGDHITAERNPNYRVKGRPLLERIIFKIVPATELAVQQVKAGEVDGVGKLVESHLPELQRYPGINLAIAQETADFERLAFNLAKRGNPADPGVPHPVLGDIALRRALVLATPKQQMIDRLLFGKASIPGSFVSQGWATPKALAQESYDQAKANQLLDQAGWVRGPDGIRSKGGVRATLEINSTSGDQIRERVEQVLVDAWRAIGVELKIRNMPSPVLFGTWSAGGLWKRGDFDIYMFTSRVMADPHFNLMIWFHSTSIPREGNDSFNIFRLADPEVDRLLDHAGSLLDQDQRKTIYGDVLRKINDNVPGVWLFTRAEIEAFRSNVGGWQLNAWDTITWKTEDWFVRR